MIGATRRSHLGRLDLGRLLDGYFLADEEMKLVTASLALLVSAVATQAAEPADSLKKSLSFVQKHCVECHQAESAEGGFRADQLSLNLEDQPNYRAWSRVMARVQSGEMPPREAERPAPAEIHSALVSLKTAFHDAAAARHREAGRVRVRRLNRLEYENTVRDLLDIDTPLRDLLPEDDLSDGFSNQAGSLSISPVHIQQYMAAADRALEAATVRQARPETKTHRFSYTHEAEIPFHGHAHNKLQCNLRGEDLYFFLDTHIEVPAYLRQFESLTRDTPGRYRIRIATEARDTTDGEDLIFSVWIAAGGKRKELLGHFDARHRQESVVELTRPFERGETIIVAPWRMAKVRTDAGFSVYLPDKPEKIPKGWHFINNPNPPIPTVGPAIIVKPVEITGPLVDVWPPLGHQLLYGELTEIVPATEIAKAARVPDSILRPVLAGRPLKDPVSIQLTKEKSELVVRESLARFMSRAFRRPVTAEEVDLYGAIAREQLAKGECLEVALNAAHRAILCSPEFLFHVEQGPELSPHELASRLSYFLWRTAPDGELRKRADSGEIKQPAVLRQEAARLMSSPRFEVFVRDFLAQWLNLREIDATTPDRDLFPEYFEGIHDGRQDVLLHDSLVGETRAFFRDVVERDLGVATLVESRHAFLNQRLAEHYELPGVRGAGLRRVELPVDSVRGGLLTQASILKVTANGANTSPVLRGAWLLERIVGTPAPPPPPNAGGIEPDTRGATTIREQLAKHQAVKTCAGCHQKIDPPGFALEAFDPIGRYREFYRTTEKGEKLPDARVFYGGHYGGVKYLKGPSVDTRSELPDGQPIADIRAYKKALAARPELLARGLVRKLGTFATGVSVESADELIVDAVLENSKSTGYGVRTLLHEVIQSELFNRK
jgi:mono/diheme cytochrome c family protein